MQIDSSDTETLELLAREIVPRVQLGASPPPS
jgi:hypothetical protein